MEKEIYKTNEYVGNYAINRWNSKWATRTFKVTYSGVTGLLRIKDLLSGGAVSFSNHNSGYDLSSFVENAIDALEFANQNPYSKFEDAVVGVSLGKIYHTYESAKVTHQFYPDKVEVGVEIDKDNVTAYVESHGKKFATSDDVGGDNHLIQEIFITVRDYPVSLLERYTDPKSVYFEAIDKEEALNRPHFETQENPFLSLKTNYFFKKWKTRFSWKRNW